MSYIDGFVVPVPAGNRQAYHDLAEKLVPMFQSLGALRLVECWGDDVPEGKVTDFRRAVNAEADEEVVFSWIEWPSREVRDAAVARMREDPQMQGHDMPFDGRRMIFGGFSVLLDAGA